MNQKHLLRFIHGQRLETYKLLNKGKKFSKIVLNY